MDQLIPIKTVVEGHQLVEAIAVLTLGLKTDGKPNGMGARLYTTKEGGQIVVDVGRAPTPWFSGSDSIPERIVLKARDAKRSVHGWWGDKAITIRRREKGDTYSTAAIEKALRTLMDALAVSVPGRAAAEKQREESMATFDQALRAAEKAGVVGVYTGAGISGRVSVSQSGAMKLEINTSLESVLEALKLLGMVKV